MSVGFAFQEQFGFGNGRHPHRRIQSPEEFDQKVDELVGRTRNAVVFSQLRHGSPYVGPSQIVEGRLVVVVVFIIVVVIRDDHNDASHPRERQILDGFPEQARSDRTVDVDRGRSDQSVRAGSHGVDLSAVALFVVVTVVLAVVAGLVSPPQCQCGRRLALEIRTFQGRLGGHHEQGCRRPPGPGNPPGSRRCLGQRNDEEQQQLQGQCSNTKAGNGWFAPLTSAVVSLSLHSSFVGGWFRRSSCIRAAALASGETSFFTPRHGRGSLAGG
mmetsp:Transcript_20621/g.57250  ORF Transcript_20621/g.57250 Transcript_20621/m.57250 type:complete len:271 (-) Transcript_20621:116-928(-)